MTVSHDCKSYHLKGPYSLQRAGHPFMGALTSNMQKASTLEAKNSKECKDIWLSIVLLFSLCYVHLSKFTRVFGMYVVLKASHGVERTQPHATQVEDYG